MQHNAGFTLIEILTAVIIVAILVTMAVPLYEKTIERSRLAEARTILVKLQDAKLRAMDDMGCTTYNSSSSKCPKIRHLSTAFVAESIGDVSFNTKDFQYSLSVTGSHPNGVCARRLGGDNAGTLFLYVSPEAGDNAQAIFHCSGGETPCERYGLPNSADFGCAAAQ